MKQMKPVFKIIIILLTIIVVIGIVQISSSELYRYEVNSNQLQFVENLNSSYYRIGSIILISFLIGGLVVLLIAKPFRKPKSVNKQISNTEIMDVVEVKSNDEIGQLVKGLNQVVTALEQTEQNRRIFYADMVRELRNPVIVERSHFEEIIAGMILPYQEELDGIRNELLTTNRSIMDLKEQRSDFQTFLSKIIEEATITMSSINNRPNTVEPNSNKILQNTDN